MIHCSSRPLIFDRLDDVIGAFEGDPAGRVVHIHDGIDHGAGGAARLLHNIADGVGLGIKEGRDFRLVQGASVLCQTLDHLSR